MMALHNAESISKKLTLLTWLRYAYNSTTLYSSLSSFESAAAPS